MKKLTVGIISGAVAATMAFGEEPTTPDSRQIVTSQYYVDTQVATKQRKIGTGPNANNTEDGGSGANGDVVTYTGNAGKVGAKKVYDESGTYNTQTTSLVEAGTVNDGIQKGLDEHLSCAGYKSGTETCWLYQMNDANGTYLKENEQ